MATHVSPARGDRWQRLVATISPNDIGDAIEALIARLDAAAGDPDLEDDDPGGGAVDDIGEHGTLPEADDGRVGMYAYGDDDQEGDHEDRRLRQRHINRIQRTRCDKHVTRYGTTYLLRDPIPTPSVRWEARS